MTKKELKLLKLHKSPINLDATNQLIDGVINPHEPTKCYIQIGYAKYYNFIEAQSLINGLEKHIEL